MADDFKGVQLRASQYQHVDGSFELTFGGTFLLMAVCYWGMGRIAPSDSFLSKNVLPFAPLAALVVGAYLLSALVHRFRLRVTAPRTGYIETRQPRPLKRSTRLAVWIGMPALTVILLALLSLQRAKFQAASQDYVSMLLPSFMGVLFGGIWAVAGWKLALPRFYLLAVLSLLAGLGLFLDGAGGDSGMMLMCLVQGVTLCTSGGITLGIYLRTTRLPEQEEQK